MAKEPAIDHSTAERADAEHDGRQPFALRCDCGSIVRGHRTASYEAVVCSQCAAKLFVLPCNPRPRPEATTAATPQPTEPSAQAESETAKRGPLWRRKANRQPSGKGPTASVDERPTISQPRARRLRMTRARLMLMLAAVGVGLAIWLAWHHRRQTHFAQVLQQATDAAGAALVAGDYATAATHAREAGAAARALGDDSPLGLRALQIEREARVWSELAMTPLDELPALIDSSLDAEGQLDQARVQNEFTRHFANRTIVVDAWATRDPAAAAPAAPGETPRAGQTSIEWSLPGEKCRVALALNADALFGFLEPGASARVLLGGEIEALEPPRDAASNWTLRLRPASAALLTMLEPLQAARWPDGDGSLAQLVAAQRQAVLGETP